MPSNIIEDICLVWESIRTPSTPTPRLPALPQRTGALHHVYEASQDIEGQPVRITQEVGWKKSIPVKFEEGFAR